MPFKTVLAVIGASGAASDIKKAIALGSELDAHLSIVVAGLALPPNVGDFPAGTAWLDQRYDELKILDEIRKKAEAECKASGLSFDVGEVYAETVTLDEEIYRRALYADVVILGDGVRGDPQLAKAIINGAVFDAHRPLLLASKERGSTLKPKRILLGWNSRGEAARAAREALDMFVSADLVYVVLIDPDSSYWENGGEPGADMATYLARHGATVQVEQVASGGRPVAEVLEQRALDFDCDLIVMGAYGHSRLRERIFGGVTASILDKFDFPVFLAR